MRCQLVGGDHTLTGLCVLAYTKLHQGNQTAEILVTSAVTYEDGNRADLIFGPWCADTDLGADVRLDSIPFRGEMKPRRAINPIAIEQRHRRHLQLNAGGNQLFRHRSA